MSDYSCPICRIRPTAFYQYPLVCHKCWPDIRNFPEAAQQLQMRLTFWASVKMGKTFKDVLFGG